MHNHQMVSILGTVEKIQTIVIVLCHRIMEMNIKLSDLHRPKHQGVVFYRVFNIFDWDSYGLRDSTVKLIQFIIEAIVKKYQWKILLNL